MGNSTRSTRSRVDFGTGGVRLKAAVGATDTMRQEQSFIRGDTTGRKSAYRSVT